eukprot:CAMPEP_0180657352 /NCGR_PEP_ID=MMETSP1037_2-20121125/56379_1 /TAXON_ID=632150 /ORGANISM="Azadinium spinosum, Strain 3D9" /LENGTH=41 /DNA_ID= /DNA_START= /DNA_END= /DNA_ORIENTATION=
MAAKGIDFSIQFHSSKSSTRLTHALQPCPNTRRPIKGLNAR